MRSQSKKRKRLQKRTQQRRRITSPSFKRNRHKRNAFFSSRESITVESSEKAHRDLNAKTNPPNAVCGTGSKFLNGARVSPFLFARSLARYYMYIVYTSCHDRFFRQCLRGSGYGFHMDRRRC